jgi:adenosylcobinamide-GDP ribazoletransferase
MILRALTHELRLLFVALQFLTRVPVPAWVGYEPHWLNRSVRHFPLVGAGVGVVGAAVAVAAAQLWPAPVAATLAVAATMWLTACFHEDGLADTFDALLGATSRDRALAIMKDSRIGTYGAAALVLGLLLRVGLLAEMLRHDVGLAAACCVAGHAAGRACAVALMAALPYGGDDAHAKAKPLAREVRASDARRVLRGVHFVLTNCTSSTLTRYAYGFARIVRRCGRASPPRAARLRAYYVAQSAASRATAARCLAALRAPTAGDD